MGTDTAVYGKMSFLTTWPVVALLFVAFLVCSYGFSKRAEFLGLCNQVPDVRGWYEPAEVRDLFNRWSEHQRRIYALTELTLDLVFPFIYGSLFAALIARMYSPWAARRLVVLPILTVGSDFSENVQLAYLAWTWTSNQPSLPASEGAAWGTALKSVLFTISVAVVAVGALISLFGRQVSSNVDAPSQQGPLPG